MKRTVVAAVAVALALSMCSLSLAGPTGKGEKQAKKTATGTIESVNLKQRTITLTATAPQQQMQTQTAVEQKAGPADQAGPQIFHVGKMTQIISQSAQQSGATQSASGFELLKVGQMVRVVYTEGHAMPGGKGGKQPPAQQTTPAIPGTEQQTGPTTPAAPGVPGAPMAGKSQPTVGSAQQTAGVAQKVEPTPQQGASQTDVVVPPKKGKFGPAGKMGMGMHALSIEILAETAPPAK